MFRLRLPPDLPPSFHGHAAHFDYYITVGTNRVAGGTRAGTQQSRLLHVPIRVYPHVGPAGAAACFDVLNPIVSLQPDAVVAQGDTTHERTRMAAFVRELARGDAAVATALRGDTPEWACMDTVNELARTAGKVSYDIAKDGHLAAVLTLARTRYRLGDAVQALVRLNLPEARVRVVRLAASLETHEEVDASLAQLPPQRTQRQTRQVYATHHTTTLDTRQLGIVLTLPSGATPAFATSALRLRWTLRVSLLTRTHPERVPGHLAPERDAYAPFHTAYQRTPTLASAASDTKLEIVECSVPLGVLPNSSKSHTVPIELYA